MQPCCRSKPAALLRGSAPVPTPPPTRPAPSKHLTTTLHPTTSAPPSHPKEGRHSCRPSNHDEDQEHPPHPHRPAARLSAPRTSCQPKPGHIAHTRMSTSLTPVPPHRQHPFGHTPSSSNFATFASWRFTSCLSFAPLSATSASPRLVPQHPGLITHPPVFRLSSSRLPSPNKPHSSIPPPSMNAAYFCQK